MPFVCLFGDDLTDAFVTIFILLDIIALFPTFVLAVDHIIQALQLGNHLNGVLPINSLLFISHWPEINLLEAGVVVIVELLIIIGIIRLSSPLNRLISLRNLIIVFARKLDNAPTLLIIDYNKDLLTAKAAKLNSLFQEPSFALAEGNISLRSTLNQLKFINFLLSHQVILSLFSSSIEQ